MLGGLVGGKFKQIEFLMCDAQGSDLSIMKGAGSALQHVDKVHERPFLLANMPTCVSKNVI